MMARSLTAADTANAEAAQHIALADAALAVAGHEVTDPSMRALMNRVARGELSGETAVAAMRRRIQG